MERMSEPEVIVIIIGSIVTIHAIYTKTINSFLVKVIIPLLLVTLVIFNWLGLL
jgi:hypothetical protein